MEKQMKCVPTLSLKEMVLRRVAILLWSDSDILASISKFRFNVPSEFRFKILITDKRRKAWQETLEPKIKEKVSKLGLPESLAKQVIDLIRPIGYEIRRWKIFHEKRLYASSVEIGLPGSFKLRWTTAGRIDDRRTAEDLVRCDEIDVVKRYEIACFYCLEDCISLLWEELPDEVKDTFYFERNCCVSLTFLWPHILKGGQSQLDYLLVAQDRNLTSLNQWAFENSVKIGNKSAAEHFFQKLTHEEREASLMRTVEAVVGGRSSYFFFSQNEMACYLLSVMTPEQRMEIVKARPVDVFSCFLQWPLQDLFLENASLLWTFLPTSGYNDLLRHIADKFEKSDHYFPKFFQEIFMQSPLDFKKCFVDTESEFSVSPAYRLLDIFFRCGDSESIGVVFRNLDAADRVKLVCHPDVFNFFFKSILMDKWRVVEVCLKEATLCEGDSERLKEAFTRFLDRTVSGECVNRKFKRFFELLDETSADKEKKGQEHKVENCCEK